TLSALLARTPWSTSTIWTSTTPATLVSAKPTPLPARVWCPLGIGRRARWHSRRRSMRGLRWPMRLVSVPPLLLAVFVMRRETSVFSARWSALEECVAYFRRCALIDTLLGDPSTEDWRLYSPVLRAKASEWKALAALSPGVRQRISPIIEFVPHWKEPGASARAPQRRA